MSVPRRTVLLLAILIGAFLPSAARAGLPSRLVVRAPSTAADATTVSWQFPFPGWTFAVQSRDDWSGAWTTPPGADVLSGDHWVDPRGWASVGRGYRVLATPPPGVRGRVVSLEKLGAYSVATLRFVFALQFVPVVPQFDVDTYALTYETVEPYGAPTQASALLCLPADTAPRPLYVHCHGTEVARSDAPSATLQGEGFLGLVMASDGYVSVLPDYLGLGRSTLSHPYLHAASEATCVVDALRAARSAVATLPGKAVSTRLFLSGYSQGGHVAMATLRDLEQRHAGEFQVTACAAGAGPYELSGVILSGLADPTPVPNPYYVAYLLRSYVDLYQLAPSLGALMQEPYATRVPPLLDGMHSGDDINGVLPPVAREFLRPEYLAAVGSDPSHPFQSALRDNDVTGWRPRTPVRLLHCSGDRDVPAAGSRRALELYRAQGATDIQLIDPSPGADHSDCFIPSLLAAKAWFDTLR